MKVKLIVLGFMLSFLCELNAQNDAFFIEQKQTRNEDDSGFSFGEMSFGNGNGFTFGIFGDENGFNFGMIDETDGFDFDIFGDDDDGNGFDFGGFDFESDDTEETPLGNGLLLLTATSLIYLKRKKQNNKKTK